MHESLDKSALAYRNQQFLDTPEARSLRILSEYLYPLSHFRQQKIHDTIVFFGSARTLELGPLGRYYNEARALAKRITEWSDGLDASGRRFVVCTGGGPGIMEAANRGARDAGAPSIGFNVELPDEQEPNAYSTPELTFQFHYFAMRAAALVVFPGGFGTFDEFFEILTLVQTGKMKRVPIVVIDRQYWSRVVNFPLLLEEGMISPKELDSFAFADDAEEAWAALVAGGLTVPPDRGVEPRADVAP